VDPGLTLSAARSAPRNLMQVLLIGAVLLFPFLAYFETAASIVRIWDSSGTYAHGYVILPISLWLIWGRRREVQGLPLQPYWPALALLALCGAAWLLAAIGEVQVVRQYAFVAMLPLSVLALCGLHIARCLAFPLAFMLFAVPFGDVFIDPLINITADFTVDALQWTGIPVYREGTHFSIPSGNWSVVEACSGVRYLISSVTLGSLYAYLTYRSPWRRALFVLMSIIVPIIANGARAYMIVMIGHLSGMTMAVGFDHLIYGWLFFGLVMFLLFWIGSYWREDHRVPAAAPAAPPAAPPAPPARLVPAALAIVVCVGIWPAYQLYLERSAAAPAPVTLASLAPKAPQAPAFAEWKPAFPAASAELQRFYAHGGSTVGVTMLYYRNPPKGTKLITTTNRLALENDRKWAVLGTQLRDETFGTRTLRLRESMLKGASGRMLVWHWYWIDGTMTSNDYAGKLLQIRQKLRDSTDDGAALMISAPYDEKPELARTTMRGFLDGELDAIEAVLDANRKR
jgi:exosortase A